MVYSRIMVPPAYLQQAPPLTYVCSGGVDVVELEAGLLMARDPASVYTGPSSPFLVRALSFPEARIPRFEALYIPAPRADIRLALLVGAAGIEPGPDTS